MAVVILGSSACGLCNGMLQSNDDIVGFPPFVANEADPLFKFSDSAGHRHCLELAPDGRRAMELAELASARYAPGNRICVVCGKEPPDWTDAVGTGLLTSERENDLYRFNFLTIHRSHVEDWSESPRLVELLRTGRRDGHLAGPTIDVLLSDFELA